MVDLWALGSFCVTGPIGLGVWDRWWAWLMEPNAVPSPPWSYALALLLGAALAASPFGWHRLRLLATWIHESGHAVVGLLVGRSLSGIALHKDTSGVTTTAGPVGGFGRFATTFAGYPAPAAAGALIMVGVAAGHLRWALAGLAVVVVVLLPFQRSWRAALVALVMGAGVWGVGQVSADAGALLLSGLAGFLLMASPRTVVELHRVRTRMRGSPGEGDHSDADSLARQTHLPAVLWEGVFLVVSFGCWWWVGHALLNA